MKRLFFAATVFMALASCGNDGSSTTSTSDSVSISNSENNAAMGTDSSNNLGGSIGNTAVDSGSRYAPVGANGERVTGAETGSSAPGTATDASTGTHPTSGTSASGTSTSHADSASNRH